MTINDRFYSATSDRHIHLPLTSTYSLSPLCPKLISQISPEQWHWCQQRDGSLLLTTIHPRVMDFKVKTRSMCSCALLMCEPLCQYVHVLAPPTLPAPDKWHSCTVPHVLSTFECVFSVCMNKPTCDIACGGYRTTLGAVPQALSILFN